MALVVKNPPANAGDTGDVGSIPGSGRCPGVGNANPLQYSCLEKFHRQRSLADYSQRDHEELDITEHTHGTHRDFIELLKIKPNTTKPEDVCCFIIIGACLLSLKNISYIINRTESGCLAMSNGLNSLRYYWEIGTRSFMITSWAILSSNCPLLEVWFVVLSVSLFLLSVYWLLSLDNISWSSRDLSSKLDIVISLAWVGWISEFALIRIDCSGLTKSPVG